MDDIFLGSDDELGFLEEEFSSDNESSGEDSRYETHTITLHNIKSTRPYLCPASWKVMKMRNQHPRSLKILGECLCEEGGECLYVCVCEYIHM